MKVFIITEGGKEIGFGHITRCTSLYQAFEEKGILPQFIVNGDDSVFDMLKHKNSLLFNWLEDQEKLFALLKDSDIVIIDSYLAKHELYKKVSELTKKAVYIDDYNRIEYPKGVVINGTIGAEDIEYAKKEDVSYLLGVKYIPLRKEFWIKQENKIKQDAKTIMLTLGGEDLRNLAPSIMEMLKIKFPELNKKIIIGKGFQNIGAIERIKDDKTELIHYPDAKGMKNTMLTSDIAISAGGQTLYELAVLEIPTIGICIADDQKINLENWQTTGFVDNIGQYNDQELLLKLENSIKQLMSYEKRMQIAGRGIVDGQGAKRIVSFLLENS